MANVMKLEIGLNGGKVEVKDDILVITYDQAETARDLWNNQLNVWLTAEDGTMTDSKLLRVTKKNKLTLG
jgi:hypothetical protein